MARNKKGGREFVSQAELSVIDSINAAKKENIRLNDEEIKQIRALKQAYEDTGDASLKLTDAMKHRLSEADKEVALKQVGNDLEKSLTKQASSLNTKKSKLGKLGKAQLDSLRHSLKTTDMTVDAFKDQVDMVREVSSGMYTSAEIQQKINDLGEEATDEMRAYLTTQMMAAKRTEMQAEAWKEMNSLFGGIGSSIVGFVTNPLTAATAIITAFNAQQEAIAKQFGGMGVTAFRSELAQSSQEFAKIGLSTEDSLTSISTMSSEFGVAFSKAIPLAKTAGDLAVSTGMSVDESSKLVGMFTQLGGHSAESAASLLKGTRQLAKANDVAPDKVLSDIAGNTELFARFGKDGGEGLLRAAVQARKLGISLESVAKSADSLLDFQASLNAEIEAQMLLGRDINLQKARELSLNNDIEGLQAEIVKQVGSEAEWNKLNRIQRDALAAAVGMETSEIQKMVSAQTQQKTLQGEINRLTAENEIPEDTITAVAKILHDFKALGMELAESIGPGLMSVISFAGSMIKSLDKWIGLGNIAIGVMAAMITKSIAAMAVQVATTYFAGAKWLGPGALAAFAVAPAAIAAMIGGIVALTGSYETGSKLGGVQSAGVAALHPGETILNKKDTDMLTKQQTAIQGGTVNIDTGAIERGNTELKGEMAQLRKEMASYFGIGGTANREMGRQAGRHIADNI